MVPEKAKILVMMSLIQICLASKACGLSSPAHVGKGHGQMGNLGWDTGPRLPGNCLMVENGCGLAETCVINKTTLADIIWNCLEYSVQLRDFLKGSWKWIFSVKDGLSLVLCLISVRKSAFIYIETKYMLPNK
jgi:hypothetical protein